MKPILVFCLLFIAATVNAQQNYDASLISKDLLPYARAVVRNEQINVEVKDFDNTVCHVKEAITVLNKNGDRAARIALYHNKSITIRGVKGVIYNSFGTQISKFSESNFEDRGTTDGFSLFEDMRVKHYEPAITDYPYTIEYEYELRYEQSLNIPGWMPNSETGIAVEKSSFNFICKPDFNIRYKEMNMPSGVYISTNANTGLKTYAWQVNNLKAIKEEPFDPNPENYLSMVKIAPVKFQYEGIDGSFTNWNELGKWISDKLLKNRQEVSPATAEQIIQMTRGITDPKLKAKKIYEYMQGRTRYVSVQIGIGGYQPFTAGDVDRVNYGDCKALVNYTQALLKVVGIDSYYCTVEANLSRKISFLSDFASMNQGNHIILCLPFKNDTTWCDCTSQTIPFGYLGDFTDDRNVLACTPEGGKLMHTPKYTAENNLEKRKASFVISATGDMTGEMTTTFKGAEYDDRDWVIAQSQVERLKAMQNIYPINNMNIEKLEFSQDKSLDPSTTENIKLKAPEFASTDNGRITFLLNPVHHIAVPRQVHNRVTNVYINEGYTDEDEITYTLPTGYHLDSEILHRNLDLPFGKYSASMKVDGNQLVYKRKFRLNDGTYPKDTYQDLVDFYQSVADADAHEIILVKNN
ncbi:protein of unknown function [Mucilaginibacter mallensis]|uniref:DUF3857 domain-containing protein n=1 Tax=Mucilaginibacter mallensis TaxID=652787 RepID=A0A1H1V999_MUCMA|nr:DUF3857 domain-containing protein [Mucilaginibacter mallensis]SDS81295.1 protein of unknown function [Mucilaginibacter mallensis]